MPTSWPGPPRSQGDELLPARRRDLLREQGAHRGAHRLDREGIGAIVDQDQPARADRVAGAQDRAEIARIAQRLRDDPERRRVAVDPGQRGVERAEDADHRLRIVLAADLVEDVLAGLDRLAARRLGRLDQRLQQRMGAVAEEQPLGQPAALARLGEDPQPLGQEQPLGAPVLLVAKARAPA